MNAEEVKKAFEKLGISIYKCIRCGQDLVWMTTKNGKTAPVTMELKNHFSDCPSANEFRNK